jgi:hypothetical protein
MNIKTMIWQIFIEDLTKVETHEIKPPLIIGGQVNGWSKIFCLKNQSEKLFKRTDFSIMMIDFDNLHGGNYR